MTTELQRKTPQGELQRLLTVHRGAIESVVPKTMRPDRLIRIAVTAMTQNKYLQDCTMVSICNSVMLSAQLGLEPNNGLGHAYLVPYKGVCTFQIGYRGLIELALRSGKVKRIDAELVYEKDHFEYEKGSEDRLIHKPYLRDDPGEWYGAYALAVLNDGSLKTLYMSRQKILAIRDKASRASSPDSPWNRWEEEMVKKTVIKRLLKTAHLSIETGIAVGLDDQAEAFAARETVDKKDAGREVVQDIVLEAELLKDAEFSTDELRGSAEKQAEVRAELETTAKQKLAEKKARKDDW
jgi:recombination protein RecT